MTPLELMLRESATEIAWPATPDLAAAVVPRIEGVTPRHTGDADAPGRRRRSGATPMRGIRLRRPLAIAVAAFLLLAATAAAIPGVRDPILDWLGLRSVKVERVPRPLPEPRGARLGLGDHTTLAAARKQLEFTPVLPTGLGAPVVYHDTFPPGGQLALVYPHGLLLTQFEGRLQTQYLLKFVGPGAKVDRVRIEGERGIWIHGTPHQFAYADRDGNLRTDSVRTAGDVLIWRRGELLLRLEGARSKAEALRIARSARAAP